MSSTNGIGMVSHGMLMPVLRNRFTAKFLNTNDPSKEYQGFQQQVVSIGEIELLNSVGGHFEITLGVEDDVKNSALKDLLELSKVPSSHLNFVITQIDGREKVLRTIILSNVIIQRIVTSVLDYAAKVSEVSSNIDLEIDSDVLGSVKVNGETTRPLRKSVANSFKVQLSYTDSEINFPD